MLSYWFQDPFMMFALFTIGIIMLAIYRRFPVEHQPVLVWMSGGLVIPSAYAILCLAMAVL